MRIKIVYQKGELDIENLSYLKTRNVTMVELDNLKEVLSLQDDMQVLLIAATDQTIHFGKENHIATLGYCNPDIPDQRYFGVEMLVEGFEEIDEEFLIRVYQRYHHLPWKILETKRTIVRELTLSDMDALFELYAQPGVTEYTEGLYERQEEEEYERAYINHMYRYFGYGMWLVFSKETGELIGRAGFEHHNLVIDGKEELALEMGYVISPKVQRQGYAYEVCQALLEYAKRNMDFLVVHAFVQEENFASHQLTKKLGFCLNSIEEQSDGVKMHHYELPLK